MCFKSLTFALPVKKTSFRKWKYVLRTFPLATVTWGLGPTGFRCFESNHLLIRIFVIFSLFCFWIVFVIYDYVVICISAIVVLLNRDYKTIITNNELNIYFRYYFYFAFFSIVSSTKLFFLCPFSPLFLSNPILCNPNVTTTTIQVISFVYVQSNLILYNPIHRLILFSPNSHQWWLILLVRANFSNWPKYDNLEMFHFSGAPYVC